MNYFLHSRCILQGIPCRLATSKETDGFSFHAVIDNDVYTCLSRRPHDFPNVPSRTQSLNLKPHVTVLPNFHEKHWTTSQIPFLGFAPSSNPFKFHFLKCLDYHFGSIPIQKNLDGFILDASVKDNWDSLERNMRAFLRACMKLNWLGIPEDFRLWPYPNNYGYRQRWKTDADARHAVMRSRQAFIPLIACISFFLHILYHLDNQWVKLIASNYNSVLPSPNPFWSRRQKEYEELCRGPVPSKWQWKERLQQETSISSEWLAYFHQLMDIPVVGLFLDVHNSNCLPWIPVYLEAKMPIMLYWGSKDNWSIHPMLENVIPTPTPTIIRNLLSEQTLYPPPTRVEESYPGDIGISHYKSRLRLPRIDGGTLPRPNEDLFSFIKRRDAQRLRAISSETVVERQSRLQREKNAEKDRAPGRKGARVYYWDLVEGVRIRTAVGRSNYEDIWENYGSRQRRYDSVADEWEVCTDLDPEDGPDDSLYDDDDDDSNFFISVQTHMNEETDHNVGTASSGSYLARLHPNKRTEANSLNSGSCGDIEDVAYHRYGFLKQPRPDNRDVVLKSQVWSKILGLIGCGRSPPSPGPDDHVKLQLCNFVTQMMDAVDLRTAPQVYPPRKYRAIPYRRPAMLGLRPASFKPTLQDYCAYEILRDDFLRSARGRAALLAGGIISRLAREVVDVNDVCDGPTGHALQEGEYSLCVWEAGQNRAFWDDQLTNEEMDLICGSYEVVTGLVSKDGVEQTAIRSWWPRSGSWRSCGLNCGYWSGDAEDWFQAHLRKIRLNETVKLMTSQEWHSRLKFKKAHTLSHKNDQFATEYLQKKCNLSF
ncbi:hypothetical protein GG344DRAFT_69781 [Lentinula edodes]|nr:hypothetical protein GG344DRAFT_69781 [Lentinula edodes]